MNDRRAASDLVVAIIGGGAAGAAAAWRAARGGAVVHVAHAWGGASSLYSGALDDVWHDADGKLLDSDVLGFVAAFGAFRLGAHPARVVSTAGVLRVARGTDVGVLDLEPLAGRHIAVADVARDDWDAAFVCRALAETQWAERTGTRFSAVPLPMLREAYESQLGAFDFARSFDAEGRLVRLGHDITERSRAVDAWLFGPWLGTDPETVERLRQAVELPVGEALSSPGGAAGARFDLARDRLLDTLKVRVHRARVAELEVQGDHVRLCFDRAARLPALDVDAAILAVGGVAAGGIRLLPPSELSPRGPSFGLSLSAPVDLSLDGRELEWASTLYGIDLTALGMGALERVGVRVSRGRVSGQNRLFAAGDVVAGGQRTVLSAVRSGALAARAALELPKVSASTA
jgi:anaerobic glycerol-3-phosphate dehydrogenase